MTTLAEMGVSNDSETTTARQEEGKITNAQELLDRTLGSMRGQPDADHELLAILENHIVTITAKHSAVNDALRAIEDLATARAEAPLAVDKGS